MSSFLRNTCLLNGPPTKLFLAKAHILYTYFLLLWHKSLYGGETTEVRDGSVPRSNGEQEGNDKKEGDEKEDGGRGGQDALGLLDGWKLLAIP